MNGRTANQLIFMLCFSGMVAVAFDTTAAQIAPTGYTIPDITLSPDHRYGVTVPGLDTPNPHNSLIEIKTGRVLAEIQATTGYEKASSTEDIKSHPYCFFYRDQPIVRQARRKLAEGCGTAVRPRKIWRRAKPRRHCAAIGRFRCSSHTSTRNCEGPIDG